MNTEIHISFLDIFIFLAVFQAIYVSFFIIKNGRYTGRANIYQGLFILSFAILAFQEFLNNTGYITHYLYLTTLSDPLNFALGPLFYLYVAYSVNPAKRNKDWRHFIIPAFWLLYSIFFFIQPDEIKYNSYIRLKHPEWPLMEVTSLINQDPLYIREYCNIFTIISLLAYNVASFVVIRQKIKSLKQSFLKVTNKPILLIRNSFLHCVSIVIIYGLLKLFWGIKSDVGMIVVPYFCIYVFIQSYRITNASDIFNEPFSALDFPVTKYQKSSLSEEQKDEILEKIKIEMEVNHYYTNNLSSLSGLAKQIKSSTHHVSQVINERLNKNFFELMAFYRVELAKQIIHDDPENLITIEEIAEKVGYNSKSTFNTTFKKLTSVTPSEYKKSIKNRQSDRLVH